MFHQGDGTNTPNGTPNGTYPNDTRPLKPLLRVGELRPLGVELPADLAELLVGELPDEPPEVVEFVVLGDDVGSHVCDEDPEGVFERPFFHPGRPCAVSRPVSLLRLPPRPAHTRECCAGPGVFKMLEDNSRDVYAGFKGEPSFIMVGVRHARVLCGVKW